MDDSVQQLHLQLLVFMHTCIILLIIMCIIIHVCVCVYMYVYVYFAAATVHTMYTCVYRTFSIYKVCGGH